MFACFGSYVVLIVFPCSVKILLFFLVTVDISVADIGNFMQDYELGA